VVALVDVDGRACDPARERGRNAAVGPTSLASIASGNGEFRFGLIIFSWPIADAARGPGPGEIVFTRTPQRGRPVGERAASPRRRLR
jgi:hypothetical protein